MYSISYTAVRATSFGRHQGYSAFIVVCCCCSISTAVAQKSRLVDWTSKCDQNFFFICCAWHFMDQQREKKNVIQRQSRVFTVPMSKQSSWSFSVVRAAAFKVSALTPLRLSGAHCVCGIITRKPSYRFVRTRNKTTSFRLGFCAFFLWIYSFFCTPNKRRLAFSYYYTKSVRI